MYFHKYENFKLLMQEAPNYYEKDEQQERGNYDSAIYMGVCRN